MALELPVIDGGWACIDADPAWSFRDKGSRIAPDQKLRVVERATGGVLMNGQLETVETLRHYRTMSVDEICALAVKDIAARDALLFLWTTSAHLLDGSATKVCRAWGFEPKTTMAWVKAKPQKRDCAFFSDWPKLQIGMGHYVRGSHELIVVARRGKAKVLRRNVPSVFFAPRLAHSQKPEVAQDIIETLAAGPRLEMFARRQRPGWRCWGDEAGEGLEPLRAAL